MTRLSANLARLEDRLRGWLVGSIANRFSAVSATLTLTFVALVGAVNFAYIVYLGKQSTRHEVAEAAHDIADRLNHILGGVSDDIEVLAKNPTVVSAVLDNSGSEASLRPLLSSFVPKGRVPGALCVLNGEGATLSCVRHPDPDGTHAAWAREVLAGKRPTARIFHHHDRPILHLAWPVERPDTGGVAGLLLAEYEFAEFMTAASRPISRPEHDNFRFHLHLRGADQSLHTLGTDTPTEQHMVFQIHPDGPLDQLRFSLVIDVDDSVLYTPVSRILAIYLGLLALLLPAVYLVTRRSARNLTRRLEAITQHAEKAVETGQIDYGLIDDHPDEVGRLARVFAALVERVRAVNAGLEAKVAERTRELRQSVAYNQALFLDSRIAMVVIEPASGRFIDYNTAALQLYGLSEADNLLNKTYADVSTPLQYDGTLSVEAGQAHIAAALESGQEVFEWRHLRADGTAWDAEVRLMRVEIGDLVLLQFTLEDITERNLTEARMREAMVVFNASAQGIMTTDPDGVILSVNPAFCQITGYSPEEAIGKRPSLFNSGRHDREYYETMWTALRDIGRWEAEIWNRRKNGEIYPQWQVISAVKDSHGKVVEYVAMFSDITKRKQQEEAIWRQANYDPLTGLANRSLMLDRLDRAMVQARRNGNLVGLFFIDLDGFKWINDTLGHDVGDQLLMEVARRLQSCVREQDTVGRLGGDEFTLIIQDLHDPEDLRQVGDKTMAVLREPFILAGETHRLSGSAGITVFPVDGEDIQTLLKNADVAMYKAKQAGKNRFQFYAHYMQADTQARLHMEAELRQAIESNGFALHYQPVVDADSGELVGAEALIRWLRTGGEAVPPTEFIPVAEDSGLIIQIGEWALREAAHQWREWRLAGHPPLHLAVNISGVQFSQSGLPELISRIVEEFGIEPGYLMLEITESVLMDGSAATEGRMRDIKAQGIGYALDDFGTGFSSLSYLKRFPVDIVKIDRGFINDCPDDRNDAHLVEAIINMAHSLDLRVTAEGVETEAQIDFLRDLGCDYLQGYAISKPVPAAEFEALIRRHQLLPHALGGSPEENRLLAALRQDDLDLDAWLHRLLGESAPDLLDQVAVQGWETRGLDLKHAIEAHLDWRRRLNLYIGNPKTAEPVDSKEAHSVIHCTLGRWIVEQDPALHPGLHKLERSHREFHRLAGQIVDDFNLGYRDSARRLLTGLKFRTASRNVMVALIDCYKTAAMRGSTGFPPLT